jgi:uncharacterized delta-60 repeat protein
VSIYKAYAVGDFKWERSRRRNQRKSKLSLEQLENRLALASISVLAYDDLTINGFTSDDGRVRDAVVQVFDANGSRVNSVGSKTAANGTYVLSNLLAGRYRVIVQSPDGFGPASQAPLDYSVNLANNASTSNLNVGLYRLSEAVGVAYMDRNGDGIRASVPDDPAVSFWVGLEGAGADNDFATTLDNDYYRVASDEATGRFRFSSLFIGRYRIVPVEDSQWLTSVEGSEFEVTQPNQLFVANASLEEGRPRRVVPGLQVPMQRRSHPLMVDDRYGSSGQTALDFSDLIGRFDQVSDGVVTQDGKIVVAGSSKQGDQTLATLSRYNSDGSPDRTFGMNGWIVSTAVPSFNDVAVRPDGSLLAVGVNRSIDSPGDDFYVFRFLSDGTPDLGFGESVTDGADVSPEGSAVANVGTSDFGGKLAIQPDGGFYVVGTTTQSFSLEFAIAKFDRFGKRDRSFDGDGLRRLNLQGLSSIAADALVDTQGRLNLIGQHTKNGERYADFALARLNSNGSLDTTFNGVGYAITDASGFRTNDGATSLAIDSSGNIYVGGFIQSVSNNWLESAVIKYSPNGLIVPEFGRSGIVQIARGTSFEGAARGITIGPNNRLFFTTLGKYSRGDATFEYRTEVQSLSSIDGTPTAEFGASSPDNYNPGVSFVDFFGYDKASPATLHLLNDKLILVGMAGSEEDFAEMGAPPEFVQVTKPISNIGLARLRATDGVLDTTFGNQGMMVADSTATTGSEDVLYAMDVSATGSMIMVGSSFDGKKSSGVLTSIRDGQLDAAFGYGGKLRLESVDRLSDVVALKDGRIVAVGESGNDIRLVRFASDGRIDSTFGIDGLVTFKPGDYNRANALTVDAKGRIYVTGASGLSFNNRNPYVARFLENGLVDTAFGPFGNGYVRMGLIGGQEEANDIGLDQDGNIYFVGEAYVTNSVDFMIGKLDSNGVTDLSFGVNLNGFVSLDFFNARGSDAAYSLDIGKDGSIFVGGYTTRVSDGNRNFGVVKLSPRGELKSEFGANGWLSIDFGNNFASDEIRQLKADSLGRVIAVGSTSDPSRHYKVKLAIAAFSEANGTPAPGFRSNEANSATVILGANPLTFGEAIAIQGEKVFLGASTGASLSQGGFGLLQLSLADGQRISSTTNNGTLSVDFADMGGSSVGFADGATFSFLAPDASLFIGGSTTDDLPISSSSSIKETMAVLAKHLPDGRLDKQFGFGGKFLHPGFTQFDDLVILSDGSLLVAGTYGAGLDRTMAILKLYPDGRIDRRFGVQGIAATPFYRGTYAQKLNLLNDGSLILTGSFGLIKNIFEADGNPDIFDVILAKYDASGKLVNEFGGSGGHTIIDLGATLDLAADVAVDSLGRILVLGNAFEISLGVLPIPFVVRYLPNGLPDSQFGNNGMLKPWSLRIEEDNKPFARGSQFGFAKRVTLMQDNSFVLSGSFTEVTQDGDGGRFRKVSFGKVRNFLSFDPNGNELPGYGSASNSPLPEGGMNSISPLSDIPDLNYRQFFSLTNATGARSLASAQSRGNQVLIRVYNESNGLLSSQFNANGFARTIDFPGVSSVIVDSVIQKGKHLYVTVTSSNGNIITARIDFNPAIRGLPEQSAWTINATKHILGPQARVRDGEAFQVAGSLLSVRSESSEVGDRLFVAPNSDVSISGQEIRVGGLLVATWEGGVGTIPLTARFVGEQTRIHHIDSVLRAIGFTSDINSPSSDTRRVRYELTDSDGNRSEQVISILRLPRPGRNSRSPFDVDDDGFVAPLDALIVINLLTRSAFVTPPVQLRNPVYYYDVNGDGTVAPIDILQIINQLSRRSTPTAEAEPSPNLEVLKSPSEVRVDEALVAIDWQIQSDALDNTDPRRRTINRAFRSANMYVK